MKIEIYKTKTYFNSLKNFDEYISEQIDKKVNKLLENHDLASSMKHQHTGCCEIKVGSRYRVYCIKNQNKLGILFVIGPAIHHKENYKKSKEYRKMFKLLDELNEEFRKIN